MILLFLGAGIFMLLPAMIWPPLGFVTVLPLFTIGFGSLGSGGLDTIFMALVGAFLGWFATAGVFVLREQLRAERRQQERLNAYLPRYP